LAKIEHDEKIGKAAFLLYLDDQIKYLSFEDTITSCKKCAFNYDINNLELCPKCNEYYKGVQYSSCIQCLPDDKKKAISENVRFKNEWEEMHKRLGID
jgi:anaerobic ribonucleoside-triphosphate reductase